MTEMDKQPAPALKEIFNAARLQHIAEAVKAIHPAFDEGRFHAALTGFETLSLMQRLRSVTEALHAALPQDYPAALDILRALAPRLNHGFVTLILPDYVALYGLEDFDASMAALAYFTSFGSSEFAVRHFLKRDLNRTLKVMEEWSRNDSNHVRRLASEGSRPRLPWSFRIEPLIRDPSPTGAILNNLNADPSLYVRKSVANHLNDIAKDNPAWAMDRIESWPRDNKHTAWIARHALRSLIKKGDRRALTIIGAGEKAQVRLEDLKIQPQTIALGGRLTMSFRLTSTAAVTQRLVVDYAIHYVKKSGASTPKVFKWKTLDIAPGETVAFSRTQTIRDFTTRTHHAGQHEVEILVNGDCLGRGWFDLAG